MSHPLSWKRGFAVSYLSTLAGLLIGSLIGCLALIGHGAIDAPFGWRAGVLSVLPSLPWLVVFVALFGAIPALYVAAPWYAVLLVRGLANYLTAAALGAAIAGPLYLIAGFEWVGFMFGPCVACSTHFIAIRLLRGWLRPPAVEPSLR